MFANRILYNLDKTHMYPAKMLSKVDFPAPEGPMIAVSSPEQNFPLTAFNNDLKPEKLKCRFIKKS